MNKLPQFFTKDLIMDLLKFHLAKLRVKKKINAALAIKSNWLKKDIDQHLGIFHKIAQEGLDGLNFGEWQMIAMVSVRYEDVKLPEETLDEYRALNADLLNYIKTLNQ